MPPPAVSLTASAEEDPDEDNLPAPVVPAPVEEPEDPTPEDVASEAPPARPRGLSEAPTEMLPMSALVSIDPAETPTSPLPIKRPLPRAKKPLARPRAPGALKGVSPAEKSRKLLARVRAGEPIHDDAFFDAALPGADLRDADLSCGQLQRIDFSHADLRMADLRESDLRGADLSHTDLRGADLRGCRLELTRLEGADLRMANLSGLDLSTTGGMVGADLRDTDLSDVELSEAMAGARINDRTHTVSGWMPSRLAEAHQIGILIEDHDRLPRLARLEVFGIEKGMVLCFTTALSFQDRFILRGLICAVLGPDCECHLDELSGDRILMASEQHADLTEVAEALGSRLWEQEPTDDAERALLSQIRRVLPSDNLRNELSSLIDRLSNIELHSPGGTISWRPPAEPRDALKHLLLKLFIPVELRWWLAVLPNGKLLVRNLPGRDASPEAVVEAALSGLEGRDRIDAALFASLIEERRRREPEIRAVAALWEVVLQ